MKRATVDNVSRRSYGYFCVLLLTTLTSLLTSLLTLPKEPAMPATLETATLGSGCFWCSEAIYSDLEGVQSAVSGYSGGTVANPTYEQVCAGTTGHAEVVQVTFDPKVISYEEILRVFFHTHDPTTPNRQGADAGTHYRSVIFYHSEAQKAAAMKVKAESQKDWEKPIVTQVVPFVSFYKAEGYHQDYFANNPSNPYCQVVINPKLKKFEKQFEGLLKKVSR
jgi:peptide-methionine (S)-S-oxide reductase